MPTDEPQFIDDDHAAIVSFADAYLDEEERDDFVNGLLERRGYTRTEVWGPPAETQGGGQGGSRRQPLLKQQRQSGGQRGGGRGGGRSPYFGR